MTQTKVRIALAGAGMIGREHVGLITRSTSAELCGIADPAAAAQDYARSLGVPSFASYEAMLDATKPDAAIIATPNTLHVPAGLACVRRGIPALIEKPVADSVSAARQLVEAGEAANVPLLIGHHRRHSPDIRAARRVVNDGTIGRLVTVTGLWLADKPSSYFDMAWRREPGGGPLLINLIHDIDCLRFVCGEIRAVKAFASNAERRFAVEDTAGVIIEFESGALGTFTISDAVASPWNWEYTSGQALYFPSMPGDCYIFGGRQGTLAVPSMKLWTRTAPDHNWQHPLTIGAVALDGSRTYDNQLAHFIAVVRREIDPVITARDGMMTLAATLAVARAALEDRTVKIAEMLT